MNNKKRIKLFLSKNSLEKTIQLEQFRRYADARFAWAKDTKLLKGNILDLDSAINYKVFFALGVSRNSIR